MSSLYNRLDKHRRAAGKRFHRRHPIASQWFEQRNFDIANLRTHSQKLLTGAGLSATLMLSAPTSPQLLPSKPAHLRLAEAGLATVSRTRSVFLKTLKKTVPRRIGHLTEQEELIVKQAIYDAFAIRAGSTLGGQRLNHSLGWIGYEQHLRRFPGDSINQHYQQLQHGIAPRKGAWGYFAASKSRLTPKLVDYEKYYVAVQTMYLPSWKHDLKFLRDWYKYRKVLVINTETGEAVVAVIADSGPAAWTGKQFGGSPEVMKSLDLTGKKSKGKVLLYFVDDPNDKVPLGPIKGKVGEQAKLI